MAIAYVTSTNNGTTSSSPASVTFAHNNTETGANHCLIVGIAAHGSQSSSFDTIASVTYNGVSMTRALIADGSSQDTAGAIYIYYLMNPASGSNNVVVTQTGTKSANLVCSAILYSGVDSSAPINVTGQASSNMGNLTKTVTLTSPGWLTGMGHINNTITNADSSTTTIRFPSGSTDYKWCDSNAALAAGSRTLTLYQDSDAFWIFGVVALKVFIQTSVITEGVKVGDSGTSTFKIKISTLVDGIKVGDVAQTYKALVSLLTDGIKVGDLASTVINPITAWVNRVKNSTIWTNKGKRE